MGKHTLNTFNPASWAEREKNVMEIKSFLKMALVVVVVLAIVNRVPQLKSITG